MTTTPPPITPPSPMPPPTGGAAVPAPAGQVGGPPGWVPPQAQPPGKRSVRKGVAYGVAGFVLFLAGVGVGGAGGGDDGAGAAAAAPSKAPAAAHPAGGGAEPAKAKAKEAQADAAAGQPAAEPAAEDAPSKAPEPEPEPEPAGPASAITGDGQYAVGTDLKPGTYRTAGPTPGGLGMCYWARTKAADGELDSILANGNPTGPAIVTIKKGDKYFETNGCQPWKRSG